MAMTFSSLAAMKCNACRSPISITPAPVTGKDVDDREHQVVQDPLYREVGTQSVGELHQHLRQPLVPLGVGVHESRSVNNRFARIRRVPYL